MKVFANKMMSETNIENLLHNLKVCQSMKFSDDFTIKDNSLKRKMQKQPDFLSNNRKMPKILKLQVDYTCLQDTSRNANSKKINDGIINIYLKNLASNFSYEGHIVSAISTVESQKLIESQSTLSEDGSDIYLLPYHTNDKWSIMIQKHQNQTDYAFDCDEEWHDGYKILIIATQVMLNSLEDINSQLIKNFRTFLKHIILYNDDPCSFCQRCFKMPKHDIYCSQCSLLFCKGCLEAPFVCKRCLQ